VSKPHLLAYAVSVLAGCLRHSCRGHGGHALVLLGLLASACAGPGPTRLILATTTSVEDSGLLHELVPAFERAYPDFDVQYTAVGSGQALELGRRGDADVLIVHSPDDEAAFMAEGHGVDRRAVMVNDFVVLGPAADPARVRAVRDVVEAFRRIATEAAPFLSRGDRSGTHRRETSLWAAAGIEPAGPWYTEAGVGMGEALAVASQRQAYILSDIATWLYTRGNLDLEILLRGDPRLLNRYSVIRCTRAASAAGAAAFADWLTSQEAQALIGAFGRDSVGEPLFRPDAGRDVP
jgi:tungstate transport system substrate-binding protein